MIFAGANRNFPDCLHRNRPGQHNVEDVADNVYNFHQIYYLAHIIAICTMWLDEGYFTFGALEHFKFDGGRANSLQNFSYAESFRENFSMLAVHYQEKLDHNAGLDQAMSDMYSKYFMRAFKAMTTVFDNIQLEKPESDEHYRFIATDFMDFVTDVPHLIDYIISDDRLSEFARGSVLFRDYDENIGIPEQFFLMEPEPKTSLIIIFCADHFFQFYLELMELTKLKETDPLVFTLNQNNYKTDDQKKELFYNRFQIFTSTRAPGSICPQFTNIEILFTLTHHIVRSSEHFMYHVLSLHFAQSQDRLDQIVIQGNELEAQRLRMLELNRLRQQLEFFFPQAQGGQGANGVPREITKEQADLIKRISEAFKNNLFKMGLKDKNSDSFYYDIYHRRYFKKDDDDKDQGGAGAAILADNDKDKNEKLDFAEVYYVHEKYDDETEKYLATARKNTQINEKEYHLKLKDQNIKNVFDAIDYVKDIQKDNKDAAPKPGFIYDFYERPVQQNEIRFDNYAEEKNIRKSSVLEQVTTFDITTEDLWKYHEMEDDKDKNLRAPQPQQHVHHNAPAPAINVADERRLII